MWADRRCLGVLLALSLTACRPRGIDPDTWDACLFVSRAEAESVLGMVVNPPERGLQGYYATCTYRARDDASRAIVLHWFVKSRATAPEQDAVRFFHVMEDRFARMGLVVPIPNFADRAFFVPHPSPTVNNQGDTWVLKNGQFFYVTAGEAFGRDRWLMGKEIARSVLRRLR